MKKIWFFWSLRSPNISVVVKIWKKVLGLCNLERCSFVTKDSRTSFILFKLDKCEQKASSYEAVFPLWNRLVGREFISMFLSRRYLYTGSYFDLASTESSSCLLHIVEQAILVKWFMYDWRVWDWPCNEHILRSGIFRRYQPNYYEWWEQELGF
jgi:hypothetical protein